MECEHLNFMADVAVNRISEVEGGPITHYQADVKIICSECKMAFEFIGMPAGISKNVPMTCVDFTEARLPIRPFTDSVAERLSYQFAPDATNTELKN